MGYDVHITRAERWCENRGYEIPREEWHAFVAEDEELEPDPVGGGDFVLWRGEARFRWWGGNIDTTDPDRRVIDKMLRIAGALGAVVQGDDGENYTSVDQWSEDEPGQVKDSWRFTPFGYALRQTILGRLVERLWPPSARA